MNAILNGDHLAYVVTVRLMVFFLLEICAMKAMQIYATSMADYTTGVKQWILTLFANIWIVLLR